MTDFSVLQGKTITHIEALKEEGIYADSDYIIFTCSDGTKYKMYHEQDCCENVDIEDICGELDWVMHSPVLVAEERCSTGKVDEWYSFTATFYEISTIKGSVTIRWHGTSNGYYSERVSFEEITGANNWYSSVKL